MPTKNDLTEVKQCLTAVEQCYVEKDALKASYLNDCKEINEEIASIYMQAKDQGVDVRAVKALVKTRILTNKIDNTVARLDVDQLATYRQYADAAEAWDTTPLGMVAQPEMTQ